jgi:hypothetical protein
VTYEIVTDFCRALEKLFPEQMEVEVLSFPRFTLTFERDGDGAPAGSFRA